MFRTCFAKFSFRVEFPVCLLTMTYIASPLTCNTPIDPHFFFLCVWLMRIVTLNLTTTCLIDSNFYFFFFFPLLLRGPLFTLNYITATAITSCIPYSPAPPPYFLIDQSEEVQAGAGVENRDRPVQLLTR